MTEKLFSTAFWNYKSLEGTQFAVQFKQTGIVRAFFGGWLLFASPLNRFQSRSKFSQDDVWRFSTMMDTNIRNWTSKKSLNKFERSLDSVGRLCMGVFWLRYKQTFLLTQCHFLRKDILLTTNCPLSYLGRVKLLSANLSRINRQNFWMKLHLLDSHFVSGESRSSTSRYKVLIFWDVFLNKIWEENTENCF